MESDLNHSERTEVLDIVFNVAWNALLWVLILLSTIRLILSWLVENILSCVAMLGAITVTVLGQASESMRSFLPRLGEILLALSQLPCLCLAAVIKLYHQFCSSVVRFLTICKSVPLQNDDLCDQVSRGGRVCASWICRLCLSTNFCIRLLWTKTSHAVRCIYQFCVARFHSHCPRVSDYLSRCGTAVLDYGVISNLAHSPSKIFRLSLPYLQQVWLFTVGVLLAVGGSLLRQLEKIITFSKGLCRPEVSDETKTDHRSSWARMYQDLQHLWSRYICSSSMTRWRMSHFRCSPRSGFYAILVCVAFTFVLTTYLYSGSSIDVSERTKPASNVPEHLVVDVVKEHTRPHNNADKFVQSMNRHKYPHIRRKEQPVDEAREHLSTSGMKQVIDVINLMSNLRPTNESTTVGIQKEVLIRQIRLLKEAMVSKQTMLPKPPTPPSCVGNLQPGEVEDILCIPRPKFLNYIKNPCWYSKSPIDGEKTLHCLPYFHILGCAKSGTTDLWNRLMSHPHTVSNDGLLHKEALWWSWYRYGISGYSRNKHVQNLTDYVSLFQDTARQIQSSIDKESLFHQILITGDASPPDFWDFRGWTNISQNRQYSVPMIITPHLMRHIYANPKFIIMFRDPIDRLYSDYFFVGLGLTAQDFHNDILASVDMLAHCIEQYGLQRCFYDHDLYMKLPVRLPFACYSVFMREWLQVFPMENFLFIRTDEYDKNPEDTLKSVMDFLGLVPLRETQLQVIAEEERSRVTIQRQIAGPMMNATRVLLEELLEGCNAELGRLIGNDKFIWS